MISREASGSFAKTESFLKTLSKLDVMSVLDSCGHVGVQVLADATPMDSGLSSISWGYTVTRKGTVYTITWTNSDIENGFPVVVMLQYGYGTGTGGYVQGRDFINPAIKPIFDLIADKVWKAVTSA